MFKLSISALDVLDTLQMAGERPMAKNHQDKNCW